MRSELRRFQNLLNWKTRAGPWVQPQRPARQTQGFPHRGRSRGSRQYQHPALWQGGALWEKSWLRRRLNSTHRESELNETAQTLAAKAHEPRERRMRYRREAVLPAQRSRQSFALLECLLLRML